MKYRLLFILLLTITIGYAQNTRTTANHTNSWWMYFGNHKITERFGWHAEVQVRRHEGISEWQQLLLRTGLDYYTPNVRFTVGYAFVETYAYGEFPVAQAFPEHRIWQQALLNQSIGKLKVSHRYRLEQRWLGNSLTGEFANGRYENRFRYMIRVNIPLQGSIEPGKFYIGLYNEVFINAGKEVAYNIFDQNRAYGAIGYHLGRMGKVEIGYLNQLVQQRRLLNTSIPPKTIIENNHTLQVALISDIAFYKSNK